MVKFCNRVKKHMDKYRQSVLKLGENEVGRCSGKPYKHILPADKEMLNIIDCGYKSHIEEFIPQDSIKTHVYFSHLNSSQALTLNLFGPIRYEQELSRIMHMLQLGVSGKVTGRFELRGKDSSEYDFFLESEDFKIYFEVKYTEEKMNPNSKSKNDDNRWNDYYRGPMEKILMKEKVPAPKSMFFKHYQLWRNISTVAYSKSYCCFVFPKEREDLEKEVNSAKALMKPGYRDKVKILTIDEICENILKDGKRELCAHYQAFKRKYLDIKDIE